MTNKRYTTNPTFERLDHFLGNSEWCSSFPATKVYHLPMMQSDHAPILAVLNSSKQIIKKPFRFENWWLLEEDFQQAAKNSWLKSDHRPFQEKITYLISDLKKCKSKPRITDQLESIEQLLNLQNNPPSSQNYGLQNDLIFQHQTLLAKHESFHRQRYKKNWAIEGDRNTSFFHHSILKSARRNCISHLQNPMELYQQLRINLLLLSINISLIFSPPK